MLGRFWFVSILTAIISLTVLAEPGSCQDDDGYLQGNGVRLYYRAIGSGPDTVIVLHGGPPRSGSMLDLRPLAQGRVLVFYDQRGGGRSDLVDDPAQLGWRHHVRDLEALRQHFGLERLRLIGSSWGSSLAVLYASIYPDRVERMLLFPMRLERDPDPPPGWVPPESHIGEAGRARLAELQRHWSESADPEAICREYWSILMVGMVHDITALSHMRADNCDEPQDALRRTWDAWAATYNSLGDFDWRPRLRRIEVPVLLMKGDASTMAPQWIEAWRTTLPNSRLLWIEDAAYAMWLDRPDIFFSAADRFLSGEWPSQAR